MDRQQDAIRRITAHVTEYRFWRHNQIIDERREMRIMALELKGLKAKAMTARANIGKLDAAYDAFNIQATTHVSDVESLAEQLGGMSDDLTFATTTLGNSVAGSNAGAAEKPKEPPAEKPDTTDRVALGPHPDQPEGQQTASQQPGSASAHADPQPNGADVLVRAAE